MQIGTIYCLSRQRNTRVFDFRKSETLFSKIGIILNCFTVVTGDAIVIRPPLASRLRYSVWRWDRQGWDIDFDSWQYWYRIPCSYLVPTGIIGLPSNRPLQFPYVFFPIHHAVINYILTSHNFCIPQSVVKQTKVHQNPYPSEPRNSQRSFHMCDQGYRETSASAGRWAPEEKRCSIPPS